MDKNIDNRDNGNLLQHREEFETIYGIIYVLQQTERIMMEIDEIIKID